MNTEVIKINEMSMQINVNKDDGNVISFLVDGSTPEAVTDRDGNIVGYTTLPEHALLFEDFKDESKLQVFCSLLASDAATAFSQYLAIRNTL